MYDVNRGVIFCDAGIPSLPGGGRSAMRSRHDVAWGDQKTSAEVLVKGKLYIPRRLIDAGINPPYYSPRCSYEAAVYQKYVC